MVKKLNCKDVNPWVIQQFLLMGHYPHGPAARGRTHLGGVFMGTIGTQ